MATVYRVAKWRETFETADSRRHKTLTWVSWPIGFQSNGYQSLIDQRPADAPALYGAWAALITIAAQCPERGLLANSRGEGLTPERMARMAHMPAETFCELVEWASSESIGWLEVVTNDEQPADDQPANNQSSTSRQPAAERPPNELQDPTRPNHTRPESASADSCSEVAEPPSEPEPIDPVVMEFPVNGKGPKVWQLRQSKVDEYAESYPAVDLDVQLAKARQWCRDHPRERKTSRGMLAFLNRWLSKSQDEATRSVRGSPPARSPQSADEMVDQLLGPSKP